jgi:hypothetical protein
MISITRKMKMSLIGLLIVSLSSCVTSRPVNFKYEAERCFVSTRFDKCRCFDYVITPSFSGNVSDGRDETLEYCDNLVGLNPDNWVRLLNQIDSLVKKSTNQKTTKHETGYDIIRTIMEISDEQ